MKKLTMAKMGLHDVRKPKVDELYYYIDTCDYVTYSWCNADIDKARYNRYNYFKTKEEAQQEADKILIRRQLEDIAKVLNKGQEINWDNKEQVKYFAYLDVVNNEISWGKEVRHIIQGVIYCLDMNFYKVAVKVIGEERLKKYLRGE